MNEPAPAMAVPAASRPVLRQGLYLILTRPEAGYERLTDWAVRAGIAAVQLRPKSTACCSAENDRTLLRLARAMRAITLGSPTLFIVNDRLDIALMSEADGVHVGQDDLPPAEVRRLLGDHRLIGLSTHRLDQVRAAGAEPIDYIGFGPLYATDSKLRPDPVVGPDLLVHAAALARHPIVAIGGLTPERIRRLPCGVFRCAAMLRGVSQADDPLLVMRDVQRFLDQNPHIPPAICHEFRTGP